MWIAIFCFVSCNLLRDVKVKFQLSYFSSYVHHSFIQCVISMKRLRRPTGTNWRYDITAIYDPTDKAIFLRDDGFCENRAVGVGMPVRLLFLYSPYHLISSCYYHPFLILFFRFLHPPLCSLFFFFYSYWLAGSPKKKR